MRTFKVELQVDIPDAVMVFDDGASIETVAVDYILESFSGINAMSDGDASFHFITHDIVVREEVK